MNFDFDDTELTFRPPCAVTRNNALRPMFRAGIAASHCLAIA